jgi:serine/threonine-protein kinase
MATVWRAHDRVLDRHVAVKILHAELAEDPAFLERFNAEATASARLTHPNVVHVFDAGADGATAYIVMELFDGETLRDRLKRTGPLPPAEAASIMVQALQGLQFAHDHGLIHRDVKPANVLVSSDGRVKVTDFGIAKAAYGGTADPTTTGKVLGSVPYLAPEQVEGTHLDARTDVYAAGAMLYELLTGRPPFTAETDIAAAMLRLTTDPIPPRAIRSGIPRGLDAAVMRSLARDPDRRFASAVQMAAALAPYEAGATEAVPMAEDGDHVARGFFRSWMVVPILAILTAAVVIVIAMAAGIINSPLTNPPTNGTPSGSHATGSPPTQAPQGAVLPIVGTQDFDPFGDGQEHHEDIGKATDGDPSTFWETEGYHSPTLDKAGVGLAFDLGRPATVTGFRLLTPLSNWVYQIRVGDDLNALENAQGQQFTASASDHGVQAITPVTGRYVLVWITKVVPANGANRAEIAEFSVVGSR